MRRLYVGDLQLDNTVDVTDPCYNKDVWCRTTVECVPGLYKGYAEIAESGESKGRVVSLSIYKDGVFESLNNMYELERNIGVDSGLCGFFKDKKDFSDAEWRKFCDSLKDDRYWNTYDGVFSKSGWGDGVYSLYSNKESTAFTLVYIIDPKEDKLEERYGNSFT